MLQNVASGAGMMIKEEIKEEVEYDDSYSSNSSFFDRNNQANAAIQDDQEEDYAKEKVMKKMVELKRKITILKLQKMPSEREEEELDDNRSMLSDSFKRSLSIRRRGSFIA